MGKLVGIAIRAKTRVPMRELTRADVTREAGVADDFRGAAGPRQITVLAREDWDAACAELGVELPWTTRRANLLVEGIALPRAPGARLRIGAAVLEVTCETDPCQVMDRQHQGLRAALTPDWRGGVSCRVVEPGEIAAGDPVTQS